MQLVKAEIIAIGDELLYGQIMDTNSHWISQELDLIGVKVVRKTTVGDNRNDILKSFAEAEERADIILITGGLGPTQDDLTKPLLAEYFGCEIVEVPEAVEAVTSFFRRRGREMTQLNILQGHLPSCCTYVPNEVGTAPGMWFEKNGTYWMSMPGVPHEMKKLMRDFVLPKLPQVFELPIIYHKMIKTAGIGESWLADLIKDWENNLPSHIKLAYLPSLGQVKLRLTAFGEDLFDLQNDVENEIEKVKLEKFTSEMIDNFFKQGRSTYAEGLASLYTYERQIPEIADVKIEGLKKFYGVNSESGLAFFETHKKADVYHRQECEVLLDNLSKDDQAKAETAALKTAKHLWNFLSGIAQKHNLSFQAAA